MGNTIHAGFSPDSATWRQIEASGIENIWNQTFYLSATIVLEVLNLQASVFENVHSRNMLLAENWENRRDKRGQTTEIPHCSGLWKVRGCDRKVTAR